MMENKIESLKKWWIEIQPAMKFLSKADRELLIKFKDDLKEKNMVGFTKLKSALLQTKNSFHRNSWWKKYTIEIKKCTKQEKAELTVIRKRMEAKHKEAEKEPSNYPSWYTKDDEEEKEEQVDGELLESVLKGCKAISEDVFNSVILVNFPGKEWPIDYKNKDLELALNLCRAEYIKQQKAKKEIQTEKDKLIKNIEKIIDSADKTFVIKKKKEAGIDSWIYYKQSASTSENDLERFYAILTSPVKE